MLQRLREYLTLALIILLPFHALAVTVLTKILVGAGHAPLTMLASWKEGLLVVILLIALLELVRKISGFGFRVSGFDRIDILIVALIALSFIVSFFAHTSVGLYVLGFKYDFLPLVAFLILRRVQWSEWFLRTAAISILWVGGMIAVYGIISLLLPDSFFYWLGYSDLHSLYIPNKPLAAFQQIGGDTLRRMQSTMSGPNQLGIWLLIPIGLVLSALKCVMMSGDEPPVSQCRPSSPLRVTLLVLFLTALLLTLCRAAWVAAFVMICIALGPVLRSHLSRGRLIAAVIAFLVVIVLAVAAFPSALLRVSSTRGHLQRPIEAVQRMMAHPFGEGLGSAGPATNRNSDACVLLRPQDDPSWAKDQPNLCVFLGDKQVQPVDRTCHCPFLPENWYLQIGVELGWAGFILYLGLVGAILNKLYEWRMENGEWRMNGRKFSIFNFLSMFTFEKGAKSSQFSILNSQFSLLLGVSIAALFLHAWEDAALAYTAWILISTALPVAAKR